MKIANKTKTTKGVIFDYENGERRTVNIDDFNNDIQRLISLNGISQKFGDCYANCTSVRDGLAKFDALLAALKAGDWTIGRTTSIAGILSEAVCRVQGMDIEDAFDIVHAMTDDGKKKLRANKQIKVAIAEIELERANVKAKALPTEDEDSLADLLGIVEVVAPQEGDEDFVGPVQPEDGDAAYTEICAEES